VIVPMHQAEALWIRFEYHPDAAVQIASGKINVVDGEKWSGRLSDDPSQNYVVQPEQKQLHGFKTADGVVSQFVCIPLGSGLTVEEQVKAGDDDEKEMSEQPSMRDRIKRALEEKEEELVGGIQIQGCPRYNFDVSFSTAMKNYTTKQDLLNTPEELGLQIGDNLTMLSGSLPQREPCLRDLVKVIELKKNNMLQLHMTLWTLPQIFLVWEEKRKRKGKTIAVRVELSDTIEVVLRKIRHLEEISFDYELSLTYMDSFCTRSFCTRTKN